MAVRAKKVSLPKLDIPHIFNTYRNGALCAQDIIAYIRGKVVEDPWVPVVIETKAKAFAENELAALRIYWAGVNEDQIDGVASLSIDTYQVIHFSKLDLEKEDCGLTALMDAYREEYHIQRFNVLVTGEQKEEGALEASNKLRRYILERGLDHIYLPFFVISKAELLSTGIDLAPYATQLDKLKSQNSLTSVKLSEIMESIEAQVDPKQSILQVIDSQRNVYARLLSTYLNLKYNLPPLYLSTFVAEYVDFKAFYPHGKMSLYERLMFLRSLPQTIGFIGHSQNFTCIGQVIEKIYPYPHTVFNVTDHCVEPDPSAFSFHDPELQVGDYRMLFPQSAVMLNADIPDRGELMVSGKTDEEVDRKLSKQFAELAAMSGRVIGISIKNSVMASKGGKQYIIYCPEELGLKLGFVSSYIGVLVHTIGENEFHRIIDVQLAMAMVQNDSTNLNTAENRNTTALATTWKKFDPRVALKPAIPLDVWLYMQVLPFAYNGLSYYDKYLRCSKDILPITLAEEDGGAVLSPILRVLPEYPLRTGEGARFAVNAFGTIANFVEHNPVLRVTYDAFRQEGLL